MRKINTLALCLFFLSRVYAQDGHYSQIFQNPLYLNPALISIGNDALRIGGIYRSQWQSIQAPYSNYGIFADSKINNFAIGLLVNQGEAGKAGYRKSNAVLAAGYHKALGSENNFLSIGAQLGMNQVSIDPNLLTFDDQYNPGFGFDETIQTGENILSTSMKMTDVNVGVVYYFEAVSNVPVDGEVGLAIFHANAPQATSFTGSIMDYPRKIVLHGRANFLVSQSFGLEPLLMIAGQGSAREFIYGLNLRFNQSDTTGFVLGIASRYGNAVLFTTQIKIQRVTLGFGFDYGISNLSKYGNGGNAMEISMSYNIPLKSISNEILDSDGDGILDTNDDCPEVPGKVELNGCPEELRSKKEKSIVGPDYDKDGVLDENDLCPYESGLVQFQGCNDQDGDGIWNHVDVCPSLPGKIENHGCPVEIPGIDSDGDGVPDRLDKCIYVKGLEKLNGCPDTDGDGVSDLNDNCPYVKGEKNMDGCPNDFEKISNIDNRLISSDIIEFETNQFYISNDFRDELDLLATKLSKKYPYHLVIEGHTDNEGSTTYNFQLSILRAQTVRDYLIARGAVPKAIEVHHFGETKPKQTNNTSFGKARNRRVELLLFEMD
jgi:type IX secretion system PorP/SprF family membrane protein